MGNIFANVQIQISVNIFWLLSIMYTGNKAISALKKSLWNCYVQISQIWAIHRF